MGKVSVPTFFIPYNTLYKISQRFIRFGRTLNILTPNLKISLFQAEIDIRPEHYIAMALVSMLYSFSIFSIVFILLFIILSRLDLILLSFGLGLATGFVNFIYILNYPKLIAIRRITKLEKNLLTALRHMLIKIRSGVPLFQALAGLSEGYDELSKEIKIAVDKASAGMPLTEALDMVASKNPSIYFRRALLQISNTIKVGADIARTIEAIIQSLTEDQIIKIRKYGRELNMWAMLYMILTVIFPTLGISFIVLLSSFVGGFISPYILPLLAIFMVFSQFFFLTFIKSRRPSMVV